MIKWLCLYEEIGLILGQNLCNLHFSNAIIEINAIKIKFLLIICLCIS